MDKIKSWLNFKRQVLVGLGFMLLCFILSTIFKFGLLHNVAWVGYGLLFVLNPVCPESLKRLYACNEKKMRRDFRIAGAIVILFGLLIHFGY